MPVSSNLNSDSSCDLVISENNINETRSFNYVRSITPQLTSSLPLRGGTGGGTVLTINGLNFP